MNPKGFYTLSRSKFWKIWPHCAMQCTQQTWGNFWQSARLQKKLKGVYFMNASCKVWYLVGWMVDAEKWMKSSEAIKSHFQKLTCLWPNQLRQPLKHLKSSDSRCKASLLNWSHKWTKSDYCYLNFDSTLKKGSQFILKMGPGAWKRLSLINETTKRQLSSSHLKLVSIYRKGTICLT